MNILTLASIAVCGGALLAIIVVARNTRPRTTDRPNIDIDFDTAKEREDKNRYFS